MNQNPTRKKKPINELNFHLKILVIKDQNNRSIMPYKTGAENYDKIFHARLNTLAAISNLPRVDGANL